VTKSVLSGSRQFVLPGSFICRGFLSSPSTSTAQNRNATKKAATRRIFQPAKFNKIERNTRGFPRTRKRPISVRRFKPLLAPLISPRVDNLRGELGKSQFNPEKIPIKIRLPIAMSDYPEKLM
jgi:hypothetical protein